MTVGSLPDYQITFSAVADILQQRVGHRLFTVSYVLPGEDCSERIYTNCPEKYPANGRSPRDDTEWTAMMERGECFVASRPDDFGPHFANLAAIVQNGLGAVINIPVREGERIVGNLNLLDVTGSYTGPLIEPCREAATLAAAGFAQYKHWLAQRGS